MLVRVQVPPSAPSFSTSYLDAQAPLSRGARAGLAGRVKSRLMNPDLLLTPVVVKVQPPVPEVVGGCASYYLLSWSLPLLSSSSTLIGFS